MDEKRSELISRALDDDLSSTERTEFEGCLADDDDLAAELESMRQLRRAVAQVADGMEPPAALDAVIKPLLRGTPTIPRRVRPVFRWLGAAAAVVLGVSVAFEVARRNPTPTLMPDSRPRVTNQDDREIFKLAPLPTAVPNPNRPLGATDHLLEEEPAHPPVPEPQAFEIIGPLTDEEHGEIADPAPVPDQDGIAESQVSSRNRSESGEATMGAEKRRALALPAVGAAREQRASPPSGRIGEDVMSEKSLAAAAGKEKRDEDGALHSERTLPAVVIIGDSAIWAGRCSGCRDARWVVVFGVQDGVVVSVERAPGDPRRPSEGACLLHEFVGTSVDGLADGRHVAEAVLQ